LIANTSQNIGQPGFNSRGRIATFWVGPPGLGLRATLIAFGGRSLGWSKSGIVGDAQRGKQTGLLKENADFLIRQDRFAGLPT
jgi:hypothetical protein